MKQDNNKKFCIDFMDEISDEWREEIERKMTVQVSDDYLAFIRELAD